MQASFAPCFASGFDGGVKGHSLVGQVLFLLDMLEQVSRLVLHSANEGSYIV